jgi:O-succinylbenzoate synthase
MKIWISPYKLFSRAPLNKTESGSVGEGFLLKVQNSDFESGYADCRPWAMFGDGTVVDQIHQLKRRRWTVLLKRSFFFARLDGVAREQQQSLWQSDLSIRSHYTVSEVESLKSPQLLEQIRAQGFRTLKIKVGRNIDRELSVCHALAEKAWFHLRLDFNGSGGEEFFKKMGSQLASQIELAEDPAPYEESAWSAMEEVFSIPLAIDQPLFVHQKTSIRRTRIIKPARQNNYARQQDVITNSLDHPLGQAFAALQAQESLLRLNKQTRDYGLQSAHLFEEHPYFQLMNTEDAFFKPIPGTGIGFDDLLKKEQWIQI